MWIVEFKESDVGPWQLVSLDPFRTEKEAIQYMALKMNPPEHWGLEFRVREVYQELVNNTSL